MTESTKSHYQINETNLTRLPNTGKLHKRADNLLDRDFNQQTSITQSMSRKGNCWDNAVMERFSRNLKAERLNHQSFSNHYEVVKM